MANGNYYEQLKDVRWQKKRLELLEQAGWECQDCGIPKQTLHIHHTYYEKGLSPWEYPDESLLVLCETCHKKTQELELAIRRQLGKILTSSGDGERLLGYMYGIQLLDVTKIDSWEMAQGVGDYYKINPDKIIGLVETNKQNSILLEDIQTLFCKRDKKK